MAQGPLTDAEYREVDIRQRLTHIDQLLADHDRKRQEIKYAPWLALFAGVSAFAAVFIAGAAIGALAVRMWIG